MIAKSDWEAVQNELIAADRRNLGAPPTAEELLAYSRGELGEKDAERMRELLVAYPELARALTQPFPADGATPDQDGYVSDAEIARQWERLQERIPRADTPRSEKGRVFVFGRTFGAIAAVLALVFGGWTFRLAREISEPRVITHETVLQKDEPRRGAPAPATLLLNPGEPVQLRIPFSEEKTFSDYRLEILDMAPGRRLWTSGSIQPRNDDTFAVWVPGKYFEPGGKYQVVLYGNDAGNEERLATYSMQVPK